MIWVFRWNEEKEPTHLGWQLVLLKSCNLIKKMQNSRGIEWPPGRSGEQNFKIKYSELKIVEPWILVVLLLKYS